MSRHRFVRNLDLEDELADDDGYDEGGAEGASDGMSAEERVQMATALPIVRAQLKDIKPPISDAEIQDSLWHYWFDAEKASSWLRKEWEKRGDKVPVELVPTPEEQPRPRRPRRVQGSAPIKPASPSPPLTALQRLSLARKQAASASGGATPESRSGAASPVPTPPTDSPGRPISKLAQLAQKRRELAAQQEAPASPRLATPPVSTPTPSQPEVIAPTPTKPLSKLQQKLAAARAARADAAQSADASPAPLAQDEEATPAAAEDEPAEADMWSFAPRKSAPAAPSTFFSLLTTHAENGGPPEPPSLDNMHIVVRGDATAAQQRVREAFGPGVESPDDIVLRTRDGRAGTGAIAPGSKPEVRPARAVEESSSEVESAAQAKVETAKKPEKKGKPSKAPSQATPAGQPQPGNTKTKPAGKVRTSKAANLGTDGPSSRPKTSTADAHAAPTKPEAGAKPAHSKPKAPKPKAPHAPSNGGDKKPTSKPPAKPKPTKPAGAQKVDNSA